MTIYSSVVLLLLNLVQVSAQTHSMVSFNSFLQGSWDRKPGYKG